MFSFLRNAKSQVRKAEAAAALENLLKAQYATGNFRGNPHLIANNMISETWTRLSRDFDWAKGPIPHKVSLVAAALADRLDETELGDQSFFAYGISLGTVLNTTIRNGASLGLTQVDEILIAKAMNVSEIANDRLASLPVSGELRHILGTDQED